jgi:putative acetyltransferase
VNGINIRQYQEEDAKYLAEIFYKTIHSINIKDYTLQQLNVWAPESSLETEGWIKKWKKLPPRVATIDNCIAGFAEFTDKGYIDCFYCHHEQLGKGIGKALMTHIKSEAVEKGIKRIWADVSITAKPFFERQGFVVIKQQTVNLRGVDLDNYVMEFVF